MFDTHWEAIFWKPDGSTSSVWYPKRLPAILFDTDPLTAAKEDAKVTLEGSEGQFLRVDLYDWATRTTVITYRTVTIKA